MTLSNEDLSSLEVAEIASKQSDCVRRRVGCLLLSPERVVVSIGWNESLPRREPLSGDCDEVCLRAKSDVKAYSSYDEGPGRCVSIHAEAYALLRADFQDLSGSTIFVTCEPCFNCAKLILSTSLAAIVTPEKGRRSLSSYEIEVFGFQQGTFPLGLTSLGPSGTGTNPQPAQHDKELHP